MVEAGAAPKVSLLRRQVSRIGRALTTPLLPDDYFALVRPSWSTRELTGKVVRVRRENGGAATIVIKPNTPLGPHQPGQYLRIGMEIDGIRHWRAYTITSDPGHPEGVVSITVKNAPGGRMSPVFTQQVRPGREVFLGEIEGEFTLPDPPPERTLFLSAGSGVTPVLSHLRELDRRGSLTDAVHIHSARTADEVIFGEMLRSIAERCDGYRLVEVHTADQKRFSPDDLDEMCPDWRERVTFLSGPQELIAAVEERFEDEGLSEQLNTERFQPVIGNGGGDGSGGTVHFRVSDCDAECGPGVSVLVGGEEAGATLPFGCRMGICHTCVGRLKDGALRDVRTGSITEASGQMVRTCINAPEGHVEIDL
ncbi:MAG: stearoyl-CoA 9-desaturase oxidoreductase [Pseudonocardiales bacterium]|jgi:ferredoxin-NADP reductase|nr:stearoyl-CoA 9-desaturase [Jatrophihabitans sp.]MDT4905884.1 stearoyl-CoA 9-desaturase oxidoreductase [Pseudonocardiales bacterium]MDT4928803.1 stearoyl-CoA 9-desaturase oxidoreductase [Pseudonocardiales bacterium]